VGVPAAAAAAGATGHSGVVLTSIQPCAASATAAAATSFMTMRPAHLYRSVSTGKPVTQRSAKPPACMPVERHYLL
jgi:hypothetical protein